MDDSEQTELPATATAMTPEQISAALGWDTHRVWSNNVQVFKTPENATIVFRELAEVEAIGDDGQVSKASISKNVASIILPLSVAKSFAEIAKKVFLDDPETNS